MNFDRDKFRALMRELEEIHQHEDVVLAQLAQLFSVTTLPATGAKTSTPAAKPKAKKRQKGQLQKLVLQILDGYKTPKSVPEIAAKVQKTRPGTTQASVATVLHMLSKRGKIVKTDPSTFFLPRSESTSAAQLSEPTSVGEPEEVLES